MQSISAFLPRQIQNLPEANFLRITLDVTATIRSACRYSGRKTDLEIRIFLLAHRSLAVRYFSVLVKKDIISEWALERLLNIVLYRT